jgi:integral membrane protein
MNTSPKDLFSTFARIEMLTWALLIAAIIARETIGIAPNMFFIAGATHGFAFIGYSVVAVLVSLNQRWALGRSAIAVILAIVPFATYPFDRYLEKKQLLEGSWRTEATKNERDKTKADQLFRWFIARPLILFLAVIVFVVSLFSFLLWLGPPGEWGNSFLG